MQLKSVYIKVSDTAGKAQFNVEFIVDFAGLRGCAGVHQLQMLIIEFTFFYSQFQEG